jgi:hypothetical protein
MEAGDVVAKVLMMPHRAVARETDSTSYWSERPRHTDLVWRLRRHRPEAFVDLHEIILTTVRGFNSAGISERRMDAQVRGLMTIALEAVFSGALPRSASLPDLIHTLTRIQMGRGLRRAK